MPTWIQNTFAYQKRLVRRKTLMERIHILFIASDYKPWPGGIAEYIDALARGFIGLGATVKVLGVVHPEERKRIEFLERYEPWAVPFQLMHDDKPTNWLGRKFVSLLEILRCLSPRCRHVLEKTSLFTASTASIAKLDSLLLEERPTFVIFGHLDVKLYPLALTLQKWRQPYGILAHDSEICQRPDNGRNDLVLRGLLLKGASWIAANSQHTKSLVAQWKVPADRIKLIHCPISEETIRESASLSPRREKQDGLHLVTICRLVKGKGVDIVIRALKILAERGIPYRYVIGGDGPERKSLEALVDDFKLRDKVLFQGAVAGEGKWRLLRQGDVYVMPSRFDSTIPWKEGFGIAFIEAAAFGVPAVASRSGGIPDAVLDGETGILVPEESSEELADALTFLHKNPEVRIRMGRAARERARRQFSPQVIANQFREIMGVGAQESPCLSASNLPTS